MNSFTNLIVFSKSSIWVIEAGPCIYLHGTATVPLGTPAFVRCIAPASVPPDGIFLN